MRNLAENPAEGGAVPNACRRFNSGGWLPGAPRLAFETCEDPTGWLARRGG
jgi:hypothetical protein